MKFRSFSLRFSPCYVATKRLFCVDKTFIEATNNLAKVTDIAPSEKLELYSLFKQATIGPCVSSRPGLFDPINRAKYDAWKSLDTMPQVDAKKKYIELVSKLLKINSDDSSAIRSHNSSATNLSTILFPSKIKIDSLEFSTLKTSDKSGTGDILNVQLSRPDKGNAMNLSMFADLHRIFSSIGNNLPFRAVILGGNG